MQFGMSTLIEMKSTTETAALCRELGLDYFYAHAEIVISDKTVLAREPTI